MSWGFFSVAFPALTSGEEVLLFVPVAFTDFLAVVRGREGCGGCATRVCVDTWDRGGEWQRGIVPLHS